MGFIHCNTGLTGEHLSNAILKEIESLGLSMDDCRGQGYDGAGAMAGSEKGAAPGILQSNLISQCNLHLMLFTHTKLVCHEMYQNRAS